MQRETLVAQDFYPFVDNAQAPQADLASAVRHPARIAVYDDAAAAPRVVVVEPKDVRAYLEEITLQVTQLAQGQGGTIPFMVIREIVENFIHAYFMEPTISILDHGNTIRFSDQGPGIREKDRALQYGTTSATEEMRHYIRGVGSGLPYAQQYMIDKGGSLEIDDNISGGTIVTISTRPQMPQAPQAPQMQQVAQPYQQPQAMMPQQQGAQQTPAPFWPGQQQAAGPWPQQQQPNPNFNPYMQPWPQQAYPQQGWGAPSYGYDQGQQAWGQMPVGMPPSNQALYQNQPGPGLPQTPAPLPQQQEPGAIANQVQPSEVPSWVTVTARGRAILDYLSKHENVGPSDLARTYGESQPTWTRELQALEEQGILRKEGQKRRLTAMGRSLL